MSPFRKTSSGKYKSPSGRTYSKKQVVAYYSQKASNRKPRKKF